MKPTLCIPLEEKNHWQSDVSLNAAHAMQSNEPSRTAPPHPSNRATPAQAIHPSTRLQNESSPISRTTAHRSSSSALLVVGAPRRDTLGASRAVGVVAAAGRRVLAGAGGARACALRAARPRLVALELADAAREACRSVSVSVSGRGAGAGAQKGKGGGHAQPVLVRRLPAESLAAAEEGASRAAGALGGRAAFAPGLRRGAPPAADDDAAAELSSASDDAGRPSDDRADACRSAAARPGTRVTTDGPSSARSSPKSGWSGLRGGDDGQSLRACGSRLGGCAAGDGAEAASGVESPLEDSEGRSLDDTSLYVCFCEERLRRLVREVDVWSSVSGAAAGGAAREKRGAYCCCGGGGC